MFRILRGTKITHRTPAPPAALDERDGLAYALFEPEREPRGGIVILHGAGSCKESHFDFARAARGAGLTAVAFDARGHGASAGPADGRMLDDVATMTELLPAGAPLALRGSSMGGYMALLAAARLDAAAVVAICPAGSEHLLRGLRRGDLDFEADGPAVERFLEAHDLGAAVARMRTPMLLLHAEGDEQIPVEHSRALLDAARMPVKRLLAMPGGHHRSIQHDEELQGESLRFVAKAFAAAG
ncbi:MAG TPA: alpha/beta fold hydrolase [Solirubrobacteraceae bacterium]|jgi:alpha-beta hydrolase superfamily lysophospholipase